jgi:hypothetical protein
MPKMVNRDDVGCMYVCFIIFVIFPFPFDIVVSNLKQFLGPTTPYNLQKHQFYSVFNSRDFLGKESLKFYTQPINRASMKVFQPETLASLF